MPDTPIYAITYPCESAPITVSDFSVFATDVEAALALTDTEATFVTHLPYFRGVGAATPAFAVETTTTYTAFPTTVASSGVTVNAAAGTVTIITPGIYLASLRVSTPESTLTVTSSRAAVAINGVNAAAKKFRGLNPAGVTALSGTYDTDILVIAGDVVTFRYLWTGTGALTGPVTITATLDLLATP